VGGLDLISEISADRVVDTELLVATATNALVLASMYILVTLGFAFILNMLGIFNIAHGVIYMIGAYICYGFIEGLGFNNWAALILTVIIVAGLGVFLERFCFRPLKGDFNRILMICVAITVILQTITNLIAGVKSQSIPAFVNGTFQVGSISVSYERIVTFAIGVALLGITIWFVNRTKWGQQMQAIAQNMRGAVLQGFNINRISTIAFALGSGLAVVAGCLMSAYLYMVPFMGNSMLVKVLIVVMIAGVGSISGIFIAGLALGILDSALPIVFQYGAASDAVAIIVVVIILLIRPTGLFGHEVAITADSQTSASVTSKLRPAADARKWTKPAILAALVIIVALLPLPISSSYLLHIFILTFIYIIAAVSLRTITISGQFPLAHAAFMGIGAYVAAMASKHLGWSPWLTIPVAALASAGIGMLTGYPFARLRALYYAMGSLFLGIGIMSIIAAGGTWTGGYSGLTGIVSLFPAGTSKVVYYYFFLGLALVSIIALYRFEFSRIGTNLKAIDQSYLVASSVGINESWYRILAVGVGCFFAGLAGAGYAHYNMVIAPVSFNFMVTLWLVMYVLIGGINSFAGPIIGTIILVLIPEFARDLKEYSPFLSAVLLLIVVYLMPKGLVSIPQLIKSAITERRKGKGVSRAS
jgi:branched-chain amino acid transport system permease protein